VKSTWRWPGRAENESVCNNFAWSTQLLAISVSSQSKIITESFESSSVAVAGCVCWAVAVDGCVCWAELVASAVSFVTTSLLLTALMVLNGLV